MKAWQKAHPGYWRKRAGNGRALQDRCAAQVIVAADERRSLSPRALQDLLVAQHLALTGLIAHLTDSRLKESINIALHRMVRLGQQIQGPDRG